MSAIKSAKDLLISHDFQSGISDGKRHPSHEFQAYAYRLAHDLNDLGNLKIYMRLAKNVERSLMEQAYSFAVDSRFENRGPIFLWKLKQIRAEVKKLRAQNSYDYKYIIKSLSTFKDKYFKAIIEKNDREFKEKKAMFHEMFACIDTALDVSDSVKQQVLFIGIDNQKLLKHFTKGHFRTSGIDVSRNTVKYVKENLNIKAKVISKEFFKNNYKEKTFDLIWIDSFWNNISEDHETEFIKELIRIKKDGACLVVGIKTSKELIQKWEVVKGKTENIDVFVKYSNLTNVLEKFERFGFKLDGKFESEGKSWLVLE